MGFKDDIVTNYENKTVEYQGKKLNILKQFKYNNVEYLCGVDANDLENAQLSLIFLYRDKFENSFKYVDSEELFDTLMVYVGNVFAKELSEENNDNPNNNQ